MGRIVGIGGFQTGTGPRGGRFYMTKAGTKVYGEAPKGHVRTPDMATIRKATPKQTATQTGKSSGGYNPDQHFGTKQLTLAQKEVRDKAVQIGNFGPLLAKYPLTVAFVNFRPGQSGEYHMFKGHIEVTTAPSGPPRSSLFSFGKPWSISSEHDHSGPRTTTLVHELGHHLHQVIMSKAVGKPPDHIDTAVAFGTNNSPHPMLPAKPASREHADIIRDAHRLWRGGDRHSPSLYGTVNHLEWFAEAHTQYAKNPGKLMREQPEAYKLIQRARKSVGME